MVIIFIGLMAVIFLPVSVSLFGRGIILQLICFCIVIGSCFTFSRWTLLLWLAAWIPAGVCLRNAAAVARARRIEDAIRLGTPRALLPPLPAIDTRERYTRFRRGARIAAHSGLWSAMLALTAFFLLKPGVTTTNAPYKGSTWPCEQLPRPRPMWACGP
jgi:hypothetical protein